MTADAVGRKQERTTMKTLLASATLVISALTLTACGEPSDADVSRAIADSLKSDPTLSTIGLDIDTKHARCIGDAWVADIGTKKLDAAGLVSTHGSAKAGGSPTMKPADARTAAHDLAGCVDLEAAMTTAFQTLAKFTPEQSQCVVDALGDARLETIFASAFSGRTPDFSSLFADAPSCVLG